MRGQFYPEMGMDKNPFRYSDRASEKMGSSDFKVIKTSAIEMLRLLIKEGSNTIIVGNKGCGKSTVIDSMVDENTVSVSGAELFKDVYNGLLDCMAVLMVEGVIDDEDIADISSGFFLGDYHTIPQVRTKLGEIESSNSMLCADPRCFMRLKCDIGKTYNSRDSAVGGILSGSSKIMNCPLRQMISIELAGAYSRKMGGAVTFLIDVPDTMVRNDIRYFENFITELVRGTRAQIILMVTREQNTTIRKKKEYFMRWKVVNFPPPSNEELKEIVKSRVEGVFPFDEDAFDYLVMGSSNNPRWLIRRCGTVLVRMADKKVEEPVGREYVERVLGSAGEESTITSKEAFIDVFNKLYEERGRVMVVPKELSQLMMDVHGIEISPMSVGWLLKGIVETDMGLKEVDRKWSPYVRYRLMKLR